MPQKTTRPDHVCSRERADCPNPAHEPVEVWVARTWDRHHDITTVHSTYELALAAVAETVLAEHGPCGRCPGHTSAEDGRTDLDLVLAHYDCTSSSPDLPCTAGDNGDGGFSLYTTTIRGSGLPAQPTSGAAVRMLEEDPDDPSDRPLAYVLDAAGLSVSVCVRDGRPHVHVVNEDWPQDTELTLTVDSHPSELHRARHLHRLA